jgi:hypothetical protein
MKPTTSVAWRGKRGGGSEEDDDVDDDHDDGSLPWMSSSGITVVLSSVYASGGKRKGEVASS